METRASPLPSLPPGYGAVVVGSSGGIGSALCELISADERLGELIRISRTDDGFEVTDEAKVRDSAQRLAGKHIHLLICATGVLSVSNTGPEKALRQIDPEAMLDLFRINAIGPALVAKHFIPLLDRESRSIAAFLSARVGSIGDNRLGGWISYRSSKAALNQIVRTVSIEVARTHPKAIVTAIHPGTVRTGLSDPYSKGHATVSASEAGAAILRSLNSIEDTGSFIAYDGSRIDW